MGRIDKKAGETAIVLDRSELMWFNVVVMRQINRKNSVNWWWPAGK